MRQIFKMVMSPLMSLLIIMLGNGYFNTFVSMRMSQLGHSNFVVGILSSAYYGGVMFGSFYIERFIRRIGHIRSFAIFASTNAAIVMIQSLIIDPVSWTIFRFLVGITCAGLFIVIESWLLLTATITTRGKLLSLYMLFLYAAQGGGQFILNFTPIEGVTPFSITVITCALSVIPVCMMRAGSPILEEAEYLNLFRLFRKAPMGFLGCFLAGMILSAFYGLGPIYAKNSGMSIFQVSQIMGFTILGGLALQWPIGHLSDIFERRKVLLFVSLILMILCVFLFLGNYPFWITLSLAVLFGGFSFTLYPLCITRTSDLFPHANITAVTCGLLIIYGIGSVLGPLLSSFVMQITKPSGLFLYDGILAFLFILISIFPKVKKIRHKEEYVPMPRTTHHASGLDPRQDPPEEPPLQNPEVKK